MRAIEIVRRMAENNAWANHRLHEACAHLSAEDAVAKRTSFFPTIRMTLNHVLIVDWFYVDGVVEGGRGRACFERDEPFETLPEIRDAQIASDRALLELTRTLGDDAALDRVVTLAMSDGPAEERVGDVLLHLFEHQIHHRGQVHAMLSGTPVAPPQLDEYFLRCDEKRHAPDLVAMRARGFAI